MARILHSLDAAGTPDAEVERSSAPPLSDARLDSLAANAALGGLDEPIPDHLVQLALKLARALDSES